MAFESLVFVLFVSTVQGNDDEDDMNIGCKKRCFLYISIE